MKHDSSSIRRGRTAAAELVWYGMASGLTYQESLNMPLAMLLDLISVYQIHIEGMEYKETNQQELDRILAMD